MGWRLPTIEELASLADRKEGPPVLPNGHPFCNVGPQPYWSSTSVLYSGQTEGWWIDFADGSVGYWTNGHGTWAWCVRGGQGHDVTW